MANDSGGGNRTVAAINANTAAATTVAIITMSGCESWPTAISTPRVR